MLETDSSPRFTQCGDQRVLLQWRTFTFLKAFGVAIVYNIPWLIWSNLIFLPLSPSSIEAAKQKLEKDRLHWEGELKVSEKRKRLAELQQKFKELLTLNQSLPKHVCLTSEVHTHTCTHKQIPENFCPLVFELHQCLKIDTNSESWSRPASWPKVPEPIL